MRVGAPLDEVTYRPAMRTRSISVLSTATVVALALVLGACGDDDASDAGDGSTTTEAPAVSPPEGLVDEGTLTACSDTPYEPFEYEGDDGRQTGYDIDLMRAIADDAGLELEVLDLPFEGILGSLAAGQCDVITSALSIKPERAEQVDFSDPYFDSGQSLLVQADEAEEYPTLESLAGERIGVQATTTGETYANAHKPEGATIVSFEDSDGMFAALASGDVAALLQDLPVNGYRAAKDDSLVLTERFPTEEQYGFAVEKGDVAMLDFVNDGLGRLRADGRFQEIYDVYFGGSK